MEFIFKFQYNNFYFHIKNKDLHNTQNSLYSLYFIQVQKYTFLVLFAFDFLLKNDYKTTDRYFNVTSFQYFHFYFYNIK